MKYWRPSWCLWLVAVVSHLVCVQSVSTSPPHNGSKLTPSLTAAKLSTETLVGEPSATTKEGFFARAANTPQVLRAAHDFFSHLRPARSRIRNATTVFVSMCLWRFLVSRKVSSPPDDPFSFLLQ